MGSKKIKLLDNISDRKVFSQHLLKDMRALEKMLQEDKFEKGVQRIGAEQEICMIDKSMRPAPIVMEMLKNIRDDHFTTEYAKFNMEINLDPQPFTGKCFSKMKTQLTRFLKKAENAANKFESNVILAGILPTIRESDMRMENLTPEPRFEALNSIIHKMRGSNYEFSIRGIDELISRENPTVFGGSITSWQVHLQVDPQDIVEKFNWAQAIAGPSLCIGTNSPIFLGKRLWKETRMAIFQQSSDIRRKHAMKREKSARVEFGNNWVEGSITELFREDLARYSLLLGTEVEEDSLEALATGKVPQLTALTFQNGMVYRWNRACYGITDGKPHLRIENRLLPSGPSVEDEIANSAFWLGLMNGMPDSYKNISKKMEFDDAKTNFINAARMGLDVQFQWMKNSKPVTAQELLLKEMLPIARQGLANAKINKEEAAHYLGIIEERIKSRQTGSKWILDSYAQLNKNMKKDESILTLTEAMVVRQREGKPVHKWNLAQPDEAGSTAQKFSRIDQLMTTDLFTVQENDLIDLAASIMNWKKIGHIPVEDEKGKLVGLITKNSLLSYFVERIGDQVESHPVKDLMINNLVTVKPDTPIKNAVKMLMEKNITCLPVVEKGKLLGLVTEHDIVKIARNLFND
ncbi:MAG: CBS domain-containing protein [Bacteroidia bacterium]